MAKEKDLSEDSGKGLDSKQFKKVRSNIKLLDIKDPIIESVVRKFIKRSNVGVDKYNTTLEENELSLDQWLQHLQEELMDAVNYIEKIRKMIGGKESD